MSDHFESLKKATQMALDKSPKGSIDEPLLPLIDMINKSHDWFTVRLSAAPWILFCFLYEHSVLVRPRHVPVASLCIFLATALLPLSRQIS